MKIFKHQLGILGFALKGLYNSLTWKNPHNRDLTDYYAGNNTVANPGYFMDDTKKQVLTPGQQAYTPRTQAQRDTSTARQATRMAATSESSSATTSR